MATQDETILLHFDIDERPAVQSIRDLKTANTQLRAERDKVNIATKEGRELVEKLNVSIDKNNKLIKDNSSALEKQRTNVGNYSKSIEEAAGNLNIMGQNVGQLGTKLTSFINPVTAVVGVVGALGAAYARSTIGAKDLAFASNQLSAATTILTNSFASLISSAEDGEGILSIFTNALLFKISPALAATSKGIALAQEHIDDLGREEISIRSQVSDRLTDNQELLTKIQDSQTKYNEKLHLTGEIVSNITANEDQLLGIKNEQLAFAQRRLNGDKENEDLQRAVLEIEREIANISKDAERKRQGILRLESNIKDQEQQRLKTIADQNALLKIQEDRERQIEKDKAAQILRDKKDKETASSAAEALVPSANKLPDLLTTELKLVEKTEEQKREEWIISANLKRELDESNAEFAIEQLHNTAQNALIAFGEQSAVFKFLASAETLISTYSAAQKSYDALAGIPYVGPALGAAAAGVAIAAGLARVAAINNVDIAAAGGADFVTKKPTMLLVGDNPGGRERVTVEPLSGKGTTRVFNNGYAMAGGGSLTFNPQAQDGGFVANTNMQPAQQAMIVANAMKNLPPIYASVTEIRRVGKHLDFKERVTRQ